MKKKIKIMNSKMMTNSQLLTTQPKKNKNKLSKQLEQEQNHRQGDRLQGYQWGGRRGRMGKRYRNIEAYWVVQNRQGMLRTLQEKNLGMSMNQGGHCWREWELLSGGV